MIKKELFASIVLSDGEGDYLEFNEEVKIENLLKGENGKIINIVGKQGKLLKGFREKDEFLIVLV